VRDFCSGAYRLSLLLEKLVKRARDGQLGELAQMSATEHDEMQRATVEAMTRCQRLAIALDGLYQYDEANRPHEVRYSLADPEGIDASSPTEPEPVRRPFWRRLFG